MKTRKIKNNKSSKVDQAFFSQSDFPHIQLGGKWLTKKTPTSLSSFSRACFYAAELKKAGLDDAFVAVMIQDLYWDCYHELEANGLIQKKKICDSATNDGKESTSLSLIKDKQDKNLIVGITPKTFLDLNLTQKSLLDQVARRVELKKEDVIDKVISAGLRAIIGNDNTLPCPLKFSVQINP